MMSQKLTSSLFDLLLMLVGAACVVFAGFMLFDPLGWFLAGSCLIFVGYARRAIAHAKQEGS